MHAAPNVFLNFLDDFSDQVRTRIVIVLYMFCITLVNGHIAARTTHMQPNTRKVITMHRRR